MTADICNVMTDLQQTPVVWDRMENISKTSLFATHWRMSINKGGKFASFTATLTFDLDKN